MNKMRKILRSQEGFTLIELMIVIVILGVLAAIIVPRMTNMTKEAKISAGESSLRSIYNGLEMYHTKYGSYPTTLDSVTGSDPGDDGIEEFIENFNSLNSFLGDWTAVEADDYVTTEGSEELAIHYDDLTLTLDITTGTIADNN